MSKCREISKSKNPMDEYMKVHNAVSLVAKSTVRYHNFPLSQTITLNICYRIHRRMVDVALGMPIALVLYPC